MTCRCRPAPSNSASCSSPRPSRPSRWCGCSPRRDSRASHADRGARADRHGQERACRSPWPSGSAARSSAATPPPSTAASTSAPTRSRRPSAGASRITSSTSRSRPRRTRPRATPGTRRRRSATSRRAAGCRCWSAARGSTIRALTRGLFPGPGRRPARSARGCERAGNAAGARASCTGWWRGSIPASAVRIQPRDLKRLVRALEVYFLTGRPLTAHFAATASPLPGVRRRRAVRCRCRPRTSATRIDASGGRAVRARPGRRGPGPARARRARHGARPSAASCYRQVLEHLHGVRDEAATRALDRAREPTLRAPSVDLVSQRA